MVHESILTMKAREDQARFIESCIRVGNDCPICKKVTLWKGLVTGPSYDAGVPKGCWACAECGVVFYGVGPTNLVLEDGVLAKVK